MHAAQGINIWRLVYSCRTTILGSWSHGRVTPVAGVLPCGDTGSLGRTGQEDKGEGCPSCDRTAGMH